MMADETLLVLRKNQHRRSQADYFTIEEVSENLQRLSEHVPRDPGLRCGAAKVGNLSLRVAHKKSEHTANVFFLW